MPKRIHLFQAYGVELEYMIVDRDTLRVQPIADRVLVDMNGNVANERENGIVTWSNELVAHLVEIKNSTPHDDLQSLVGLFHSSVSQINDLLASNNAMLLPGAMHPTMNPAKDMVLWPHDQHDIYRLYDKIFDCKGHGWSNVQSTHLNLPFYDDEEFSKLHTAIRLLLPLIPALSASSPIVDGRVTAYLDRRLHYYQHNQRRIPSLTGKVVPERIFSKRSYQKMIYDRIAADIKPFDPEGILDPIWLNSRGAMARFDRGSIEIRIIDIQESPVADISILMLIVNVLKLLVSNKLSTFSQQEVITTDHLHELFGRVIRSGRSVEVSDAKFLQALGIKTEKLTVGEIWRHLADRVENHFSQEYAVIRPWLDVYEEYGSLAERIILATGTSPEDEAIKDVYSQLANSLANNRFFIPIKRIESEINESLSNHI
jgi:carboxylate-amine ligase